MSGITEISLLAQAVIGSITGIVTGLTGASGMAFLVSSLLILNISAKQIIASTFLITGINSLFAFIPYWRKQKVSKTEFVSLILPALLGGVIGFSFSGNFHNDFLRQCLIGIMFVAGLNFIFRGKKTSGSKFAVSKRFSYIVSLISGMLIGCFGGGGTVFMSLLLIALFGFEFKKALTLSFAIAVFTCLPLAFLSYLKGNLIIEPVLVIILASLPCAYATGLIAQRIPDRISKKLLGAYLLATSSYMIAAKFL